MSKDWLRYDRMVEDALRGVVRRALTEVGTTGLPGEHHFYLTFRTGEAGVEIAPALKAQYPKEMTIVLQHQFWGLEVGDDGFAVTLSFGGKHERLVVPYRAIVSFADPSVKFGLQFESGTAEDGATGAGETSTTKALAPKDLNDLPRVIEGDADTKSGAQIVALDAFRKK